MKRSNALHPIFLTVICVTLLVGCVKQPASEPLVAQKQVPTESLPPSDPIDQAINDSQAVDQNIALERVHFAFDKYSLSAEAQNILLANAAMLKTIPDIKVRIEGHCDDHGSDEYNLALGERRAQAVRAFLVHLGIDPVRLETISYGEEMPIDISNNELAWAKNRRAEFKVIN